VPWGFTGPGPIGGSMRSRRRVGALIFTLTAALVAALYAGPAYAKQPDPTDGENFEVYTGTVTPAAR
jgi:hypothetical protein